MTGPESLRCPECKAEAKSVIGHEDPNVFDGILYWSCGVCTFAWPRKHVVYLRNIAAENAVEIHNEIRRRAIATLGEPRGEA